MQKEKDILKDKTAQQHRVAVRKPEGRKALSRHSPHKLHRGSFVIGRELRNIHGNPVTVPDRDYLVHLQFRRFAGCPVCNLHLQSMAKRHLEIENARIREVVIFHSTVEDLLLYAGDFPFDIVADPQKQLYLEFGVESAASAVFSISAWWPIIRAVFHSLWMIIRHGKPVPPVRPHGGSLGLPADFLIAGDGSVLAFKYGAHADDQWSVDQLLEEAYSAHSNVSERKELNHE